MKTKILLPIFVLFLIQNIGHAQKKSAVIESAYVPSFPPPENLKSGKSYTFQGEKDELEITLQLKRKSETKIQYRIDAFFPNGQKLNEKGIAKITPGYGMGDEERLQESTGEMVSCTLYFNEPAQDLHICIGYLYGTNEYDTPLDDNFFVEITFERNGYPPIDLDISPEFSKQ